MDALLESVSFGDCHAVLESFTGSWQHAIKLYPAPDAPPSEMTAGPDGSEFKTMEFHSTRQ